MRRVILPLLGIALIATGCQNRKLSLGETADLMNEVSDILGPVKDTNAFEAVKSKLKPKMNRLRESSELNKAQQQNANRPPTKEDMDRVNKEFEKLQKDPDWQKFQQAMWRYIGEVMRVSMAVPGAGKWIADESGGTWNSSNK
jgi:hypothetical protein